VAAAKAAHYNQLYEGLNTQEGAGAIYRLANARHRSTQDIDPIKQIKDNNRQVLRDSSSMLRRWSEYFWKISKEEFLQP
jgi:hypothetical protein